MTGSNPIIIGRFVLLAAFALCVFAPATQSADLPPLSQSLIGSTSDYVVKQGDTLNSIGSRYGVQWKVLARMNGIERANAIAVGQIIHFDNRHIVPADLDDGLTINLPQRLLFLVRHKKVAASYPIAPGRPTWPTPTGTFEVIQMTEKPVWYVPKSIQAEMARAGKVVKTQVPAGPNNPLGRNWIGLSFAGYGIHGTNAPLSIYDFQSSGCIRLHSDDAEELFGKLSVGEPGVIVYEPILVARLDDGRIFLEVHRDVYNKKPVLEAVVRRLAEANGFNGEIDWSKAALVIDRKDGLAQEIDRGGS